MPPGRLSRRSLWPPYGQLGDHMRRLAWTQRMGITVAKSTRQTENVGHCNVRL